MVSYRLGHNSLARHLLLVLLRRYCTPPNEDGTARTVKHQQSSREAVGKEERLCISGAGDASTTVIRHPDIAWKPGARRRPTAVEQSLIRRSGPRQLNIDRDLSAIARHLEQQGTRDVQVRAAANMSICLAFGISPSPPAIVSLQSTADEWQLA